MVVSCHGALPITESSFRERYRFTPTPEQIETLHHSDCAVVFSQLNHSWQGIDTIARQIGLSEKRVTQALKQLSTVDLAMGGENAWLRNFSLDDVEQARLSLLHALKEPMMLNDWTQPFLTQWNGIDLQAAIALLMQEGLIQYDSSTGKYQRRVHVKDEDSLSVTLAEIRIDGGTQPRMELNQAVIAEYGELLEQGIQFPAITVYFDGVSYWLADGFHRYWAAQQANTELPINIIRGGQRDAILHSVGVNANHGLRRSNADKRKAVTTLLQDEEWSRWSNRAIARQCKVNDKTVAKIRRELAEDNSICGFPQMGENHTRKVKRGKQVYQQQKRQSATVAEQDKMQVKRQSIIPKVRSDINQTICQFLNVDRPSDANWESVVYLIPEDLDLEFDRFLQNLKGGKIESAIVVTENQAGPQQDVKDWANAVCLVSDSQSFCARLVWYFGRECADFLSLFSEYGVTFLLSKKDA